MSYLLGTHLNPKTFEIKENQDISDLMKNPDKLNSKIFKDNPESYQLMKMKEFDQEIVLYFKSKLNTKTKPETGKNLKKRNLPIELN